MSDDLIRRSDAIKAIWGDDINSSEDGMVFEAQSHIDRDMRLIPSADRPSEIIYGNEHNCIMTIFGECSYAETGCGDCAVVEKVRKALSADRPQGWIPCSERLPEPGSWAIWCSVKGIIQVARWKEDAIDHFFPDQGFFQLEDAVAWMPLPKPWKGADDE